MYHFDEKRIVNVLKFTKSICRAVNFDLLKIHSRSYLYFVQGVTEANYRALMAACTCLADLADMSVQQLEPLMGSQLYAKKLHDFLHAPCPVAGT